MSSAIGITYEDVLFKKMRPQGVVFLSILVLEGPDIIKFIAPQEFMDVYLENQLYNQDPCLIVSQDTIGFYKWGKEKAIKYTLLGNIKTHKELLEIYKKEKGYDA